jgi:hypothetical protein
MRGKPPTANVDCTMPSTLKIKRRPAIPASGKPDSGDAVVLITV